MKSTKHKGLPDFLNPPPPPLRILTEDELRMIEAMGATGFSPDEIAEVLMVNADSFLHVFNDKNSEEYKRFRKGFLEQSLILRQRIFKDAGHGSSPAQTLAKKILDDAEYKQSMNAQE
jgi:hypothetical protein